MDPFMARWMPWSLAYGWMDAMASYMDGMDGWIGQVDRGMDSWIQSCTLHSTSAYLYDGRTYEYMMDVVHTTNTHSPRPVHTPPSI